jgi:hypothetical protein
MMLIIAFPPGRPPVAIPYHYLHPQLQRHLINCAHPPFFE